MPGDRRELKDLVDNPPETLDVELKNWVDLATDRVAQAKIARHIAALANHGGGYLVFGFDDNRTPNPSCPFPRSTFNRDRISSIVQRYLTPAFQCEVEFVESSAGVTHPVVWVPSHGAVPVCSKADGPHDERERPQGIRMATYYVRAPGPQSVPITVFEQWEPLIRRCIVHERTTLVAMFDSLLRAPAPPNPTEVLKRWHDRADSRFVELARQPEKRAPASVLRSRYQLSYAIRTGDGQILDPASFIALLRDLGRDVHDQFREQTLFYPYTRPETKPGFVTDRESGEGERELLEAVAFPDHVDIEGTVELWRASLDGRATQIQAYQEDREVVRRFGLEPGRWFWPYLMVRDLAELVRHARALTQRFVVPQSVEFRCEWRGLIGREIADPDRSIHWLPGKIARSDGCVTVGEWSVAELVTWPRIVVDLGGRVMRLFDPSFDFSPSWVAQQGARFGHYH